VLNAIAGNANGKPTERLRCGKGFRFKRIKCSEADAVLIEDDIGYLVKAVDGAKPLGIKEARILATSMVKEGYRRVAIFKVYSVMENGDAAKS